MNNVIISSFGSRSILKELLEVSNKLSSVQNELSNIIKEVNREYRINPNEYSQYIDHSSRNFLRNYHDQYTEFYLRGNNNDNYFNRFARRCTGIQGKKELISALILGESYSSKKDECRISPYRMRGDNYSSDNTTSRYKVGSKILKLGPYHHSYLLDMDLLIGEYMEDVTIQSELGRKFSNSVIFRNITINNRRISIINKHLPKHVFFMIEKSFKIISYKFYSLYEKLFLDFDNNHITGFIKERSYIDHAKAHLGCKSAISIDISKFYDNISLLNIIQNNLFYDAMVLYIEKIMKIKFIRSSFECSYHYDLFCKIIGMINLQFISIMSFLTHNGLLPTGAHYSPNISNILLSNIDSVIINKFISNDDLTYTRYADDICISSKKGLSSTGEYVLSIETIKEIEVIINKYGFHLNYDKTKIMAPKDKKKIAGIILDHSSNPPRLSIGSARKMELRKKFENKKFSTLNSSEYGVLNWVKTINKDQYNFILGGIKDL